jgi:hypothetical protein
MPAYQKDPAERIMKKEFTTKLFGTAFTIFIFAAAAGAQGWGSPNAYGYNTGYGTVYGTFQHAALMQSMYNVTRCAQLNCAGRSSSVQQPGKAAAPAARPAPAVVRNYGVFRPDATVDTGRLMAESLGSSAEEKALIKQIYAATKAGYDKEAAAKGWKNNIAGGLTFFTVAAITIYHDTAEPDNPSVDDYFKTLNAAIDGIPEFASVPNKDKQSFNNMMIGFGGLLLATYTEGKQNKHPETVASARKLAGMLLEMVLKADPEKMQIEGGKIVLK